MSFLRSLLCFCLVACCAATAHAGGKTLVLGSMGDSMDKASMAVLTEAYGRLGIEIRGRVFPAARSLKESAAGRVDGEANRIREVEGEQPELIRIPVPVNIVDGMIFVNGDHVRVRDWDDLKQYRVGIRLGIRAGEMKTEGFPKVRSFSTYGKAFDLLAMKRLDAVLAPRCVGQEHIRRLNVSGMHPLEPPFEIYPLYHYLNKSHADLVPRITEVLEEMDRSGRIGEILRERGVSRACSKAESSH